MRVGIICEGSTDYPVLRAIVAAVLHSQHPAFSLLQPDFDGLRRPAGIRKAATGWQAVRAFLQEGNAQISPLDLIVVQIDASVRRIDSVARKLETEGVGALCDHVK